MAPDSHDRWLFLLTLAAIPLACTDEVPGETPGGDTTGTTTTSMPSDTTTEGSTSIVTTTGVDDTSSSGGQTTVVDDSSSGTSSSSSSSSDGTTMSIDPSTSTSESESSSTTGDPQGLCEVWGENRGLCYGYNADYYIYSCYNYFMYVDVACGPAAAMVYQCESTGCFVDCSNEYEAVQICNEMVLAEQLGCDIIPEAPAPGTIDMQCIGFVDQVEVCTASGYYVPWFSYLVEYYPDYAQEACVSANSFTYPPPPLGMGDTCGGAYEELLTCLSLLSCIELESAIFDDTYCIEEKNALTCRCDLGA
jgi:hypothetical protein